MKDKIKLAWQWVKNLWLKSYGYGWILVILMMLILIGLTVKKSDTVEKKDLIIDSLQTRLSDHRAANNALNAKNTIMDSLLKIDVVDRERRDANLLYEIHNSQKIFNQFKLKQDEKINGISNYNNAELIRAYAEFE